MKRINLSILIALISFISVFAHDMSRDVFKYNYEDSTCILIRTYGTAGTKTEPSRPMSRSYGEYINGYRFIAVGDGSEYLDMTNSISLPASIQYINDNSLRNLKKTSVSIPQENELKYIGHYALPQNPFSGCHIYINKNCYVDTHAFASIRYDSFSDKPLQGYGLYGSDVKIDPEHPYWGLKDGMLFQKDSVNIVRYFVHKEYNDTLEIPKQFTHINQISTCSSSSNE